MKQIPLTQGKFAVVDDEDYDFLMQWKWYCDACGYAARTEYISYINGVRKNKRVYMHRAILNLANKAKTDHINGDRLDNQRSNLRACTSRENNRNRKKSSGCTSKYKGVCRHRNKWTAHIKIGTKRKYIGIFTSEVDAATAYNLLASEHFGEFAKLNMAA